MRWLNGKSNLSLVLIVGVVALVAVIVMMKQPTSMASDNLVGDLKFSGGYKTAQ